MVQLTQPESARCVAPEGEAASCEPDDLEAEPVATLPGTASRTDAHSPAARTERLRRRALELRVEALKAELECVERRHDAVIEQYERVLEGRAEDGSAASSPAFSWLTQD